MSAVPGLALEQFREAKRLGFPGWETAVLPGHEGAAPYVEPVDVRFGPSSFPFGEDPATACSAFERWCADSLAGDHFVTAGAWTGLVYCRLKEDADLLRRRASGCA